MTDLTPTGVLIRTLIKLAAIIAWLLFLRVIGRRPCWPFKQTTTPPRKETK
jgi:hypothetical protein